MVEPLHVLRWKDNFTWPTSARASFDKVKYMIVNSSVLALFDPRVQTVLSIDTSHYGLEADLTQVTEGGTDYCACIMKYLYLRQRGNTLL